MTESNRDTWRRPPEEGRHYDPILYRELQATRNVANACGIFVGVLLVISLTYAFSTNIEVLAPIFITTVPIGIGFSIWHFFYSRKLRKLKDNIEIAKMNSVKNIQSDINIAKAELGEARMAIKNQEDILTKIQDAQRTGDIIVSGNQAPVIIDSQVISSFNTIMKDDPELASAIKLLGGYIEESKSKEAADYYKELHRNIASGERNKVTIKALWRGIVSVLPGVEKLTNVAAKISTLIS